jgi:hypothetical protein
MTKLYNIFGTMPSDKFTHLVDKSNSIGQILLSYFLAFHVLSYQVISHESPHRDIDNRFVFVRFLRWATDIHQGLPPGLKFLNQWCYDLIITTLPQLLGGEIIELVKRLPRSSLPLIVAETIEPSAVEIGN